MNRRETWFDFTINIQLPDAARNQLRVLGTEVEDKNLFCHGGAKIKALEQIPSLKNMRDLIPGYELYIIVMSFVFSWGTQIIFRRFKD